MNKVPAVPVLPLSPTASTFMPQLLSVLKAHASALNQAADGRLLLSVPVAGAYDAGVNDHVILCKPTAPFTLTLPDVKEMVGKLIHVKRANNTTHTITVETVAGLIDGAASVTLTTAYQSRSFFSDGTAYHLIT